MSMDSTGVSGEPVAADPAAQSPVSAALGRRHSRSRRSNQIGKMFFRSFLVYALLLGASMLAATTKAVPPYVHDFFARGGALVVFGLPLGVFAAFAPPIFFARWCSRGGWDRTFLLPLFVFSHALVVWSGLSATAPLETIHHVVGTPIFHWGGDLEIMGRFLALFGCVSVLFVGGAHLAASIVGPQVDPDREALARWCVAAALLLSLSHVFVIRRAPTDSIVDLMAGGGTLLSSFWLGIWFLNLSTSASSLAAAMRVRANLVGVAIVVTLGLPLGLWAFTLGTTSNVVRNGYVISVIQYLFGSNAEHPAPALSILLRYFAAHIALVLAVALVQMPFAGRRRLPVTAHKIPRRR